MNRLHAELQRLYLPPAGANARPGSAQAALIGPAAQVRALVVEVARAASWKELAALWQGVQQDLDLPAPAIAVSGTDACQLWFSLVEPVPAARAREFLLAVGRRYLAGVAAQRIRLHPAPDASAQGGFVHLGALPPAQVAPERWSAFVAPDLAPLFADEPWLDHPPGADAQADLLSRVESTRPEDFQRALARLAQAPAPAPSAPPAPPTAAGEVDPRTFLLSVMRDPAVDLRLRIEAAKALLPRVESEPKA